GVCVVKLVVGWMAQSSLPTASDMTILLRGAAVSATIGVMTSAGELSGFAPDGPMVAPGVIPIGATAGACGPISRMGGGGVGVISACGVIFERAASWPFAISVACNAPVCPLTWLTAVCACSSVTSIRSASTVAVARSAAISVLKTGFSTASVISAVLGPHK